MLRTDVGEYAAVNTPSAPIVVTPEVPSVVNKPAAAVVAPTVPSIAPTKRVLAVMVVPVMVVPVIAAAAVPPMAGGDAK